jgi:hypothetical protein
MIILCTLNAKYIHSSLALRYLYANLGELQEYAAIHEYTINKRIEEIAEELLSYQPKIIGFGVYIWNIDEINKLVAVLKTVQPDITIVLGGPEVSYEAQQSCCELADYIISGQADIMFAELCHAIVQDSNSLLLTQKFLSAPTPDLTQLELPYIYYNDEDIKQRIIYVEASRGCPFKCEFCLSALDKTAYPFDQDKFLQQMLLLYQRGARHFKFVDRTFNLKVDASKRILEFFLDLADADIENPLFLHFELIPDNLPEKLRSAISAFKPGSLQFEIGIQSLDESVQTLISRKQNRAKVEQNIKWLNQHSQAHLHTDLIVGLPAQTLSSIAEDFNCLIDWQVEEIQVGILKRLRGTPIIRHCEEYQLCFNPAAPYTILKTSSLSYQDIQRMVRFARYWDMIGNSGRFRYSLPLILSDTPFANFMRLSIYLFERTQQTHGIALKRLFTLVRDYLVEQAKLEATVVEQQLSLDFHAGGYRKGIPDFIQPAKQRAKQLPSRQAANKRQQQHHSPHNTN